MPPDHEVSRLQAVTIPPTCCGGSISSSLQLRPTNENNVTRETPQPNIQHVAVGAGIGANESEGRRQNTGFKSKYYLSPALRAAFATVGATDKTYTFQEILSLLKAYLYANRRLFDPADILFVNCANDPLGHVFKVERFHYNDVRNLISRHIIPEKVGLSESLVNLQPSGQSCELGNERTLSDSSRKGSDVVYPFIHANGNTFSLASSASTECEDLGTATESRLLNTGTERQGTGAVCVVPGTSRQRAEEFGCSSRRAHQTSSLSSTTLQFPVPAIPESNSDAETEYSFQGYETALCRNTEFEDSDESSESEFVEYEIASDDDMQELAHSDDNDSVIEDVEVAVLALQTLYEDDLEEAFWADDSDTDQSTDEDQELLQDKWDCVTCGIKNKPFVRYCEKCWQLRKNWLPERPKKKRKRRPNKHSRRRNISTDLESSTTVREDNGHESCDILRSLSTATTVSLLSNSRQDFQCEQVSSQDSGISLSPYSSTQSLQDLVMEVPANSPSSSKSSLKTSSNLQSKTSQKNSEASGESSSYEPTSSKRKTSSEDESQAKKCKSSEDKEMLSKDNTLNIKYKSSGDQDLPDESESKMEKFHRFLKSEEGMKWIKSISTKEFSKAIEASSTSIKEFSKGVEASSTSKKECSKTVEASSVVHTEEYQMCLICCIRPKNATITHGRLSHQATCYQCARRLLDSGARCPVCRRKIHMVSKNIIV